MRCLYCEKELEIFSDPLELSIATCKDCKVRFRFLSEDTIIIISWYVKVDDKFYKVSIYHASNACGIFHYKVFDDKTGLGGWYSIKHFDFIPKDWTPHNAAHKIKTYLPFL